MSLSKKPYKGTRDFFPAEMRLRQYLFQVMAKTAEQFGYEPYDGPLLEELDLYRAKSGDELINDQVYSFTDRGEREVAIRPEMTPTVARMVAQVHRQRSKPLRWYSFPNLMRYERPQKGRLREHWQFNCDIFGGPSTFGEVEIIQLIVQLMKNFGANHQQFTICLNNRQFVDQYFQQEVQANKEQATKLYRLIDRVKKITQDKFQEQLDEVGLSDQQKKSFLNYLNFSNFDQVKDYLKQSNSSFLNFIHQIKELSLDEFIEFDPHIVRGLDYYTGTVFEVFDLNPENRRAICGGGAYANLLEIFNEKPLPGVGFGLGDVTLTDFLKTHKLLPSFDHSHCHLFLTFQSPEGLSPAQDMAQSLRSQGLEVILHPESIKFNKAFPIAEQKGAQCIGFIDEKEIKSNSVQIKRFKDKEQKDFKIGDTDKLIVFLKS